MGQEGSELNDRNWYDACLIQGQKIPRSRKEPLLNRSKYFALGALALFAARADAQGYPRTVRIPPNDSVQVYNRSMFDRGPGARRAVRRLDFLYSSSIAATDSVARHEQADRAAQIFGPEADALGIRQLSIGLCDTRSCADGRSPPAAWFLYERGTDGWRRVIGR